VVILFSSPFQITNMNFHPLYQLLTIIFLAFFTLACDDKNNNGPEEKPLEVNLAVNPLQLNFEASGGQQIIAISSNGTWRIEFDASSWCRPNLQTSKGDAQVTIMADPNDSTLERNTSISLSAPGTEMIIITISQHANEEGVAEPDPDEYIEPDKTGMRDMTSLEFAKLFSLGWNLGNSLEAISVNNNVFSGGENTWGNPLVSKQLIDSVKAAGFNTIRIPVSWSHKLDDKTTYKISKQWLLRVEEVVNHTLDNDMFVKINIHWDGGWLDQPFYNRQQELNSRLASLWKQIAIHFRDYDDRLLFAGTNEVHVTGNYGTPSQENVTVQNSFNQTFVETVRATGGRNAYRHLVVQAYNTNIDHAVNFFVMPQDQIAHRLMAEVHFYDPYDFALMESGNFKTQWGQPFAGGDVSNWAQEAWVNTAFGKMKTHFIDKGIPVLLGEYGAILRSGLLGDALQKHIEARNYYLEYVTRKAVEYGMVPYYWDNGHTGNNGFGLFNRHTGAVVHRDALNAILKGAETDK